MKGNITCIEWQYFSPFAPFCTLDVDMEMRLGTLSVSVVDIIILIFYCTYIIILYHSDYVIHVVTYKELLYVSNQKACITCNTQEYNIAFHD